MQPNNPNQFTEKAWEAISHTPDISKTSQNQQIETEHLMKALLEKNGLATSLFSKAGVSTVKVQEYTDTFINRQPKVKNTPNNIYLGRSLDALLDNAEKYRQEYTDEYISIEHLILAYLKDDHFGKNLYKEFKLDEVKLKKTISQIRGNQKVTDKHPEGKYEALEKYGRDLTEFAREGKLDPVIGRDDEIRRTIQILSRRT
ncbi:MAG: ATP-dependent chaperone ClpB, partial [Trichodesmium sp. MAG_R03]|nr:ATP-dependent chaperone ClpB [Trichodesmium sp. MAG_R03]